MFAMLRRPTQKQIDNGIAGKSLQPENHKVNPMSVPIGVSMKFQYGSGDTPLDGYKIRRGVGSGGFGEVYFAESDSGKEVALKRIQKNLEVEVRGVRHCLNLRHPNLVGIYDIKFDKLEQGWIVMEYIEGDSLRDRMDRSPQGMTAPETMQLFSQLAAGVAYLHDQGIVHRDLKPANVFIDGGLVKIGDYGLSKYISASRRGGQTESVGTFHYMAPEIGKGEYGKEIDIYSLGIILYELLTGNVPFDGESSQEIILKHLTADPDLSQVQQPFAYVIQKSLAKNPALRFRDCREMLSALGWELDASGLAVKKSEGIQNDMPPVIQPVVAHSPVGSKGMPVARPIGSFDATIAGNPGPDKNPWKYRYGYAGANSQELYREPIARAVNQVYHDAHNFIRGLPPGGRAVAIVVLVLFLLFNAGLIAPLLFVLFGCYACYYVIWYICGGGNSPLPSSSHQSPVHQARMQPVYAPPPPMAHHQPAKVAPTQKPIAKPAPIPYRVALRNWQTEQRDKLKARGFWTRSHEYTRSWAFSGIVSVVMSVIAGMLLVARSPENVNGYVTGIAWTGIMSLLTTWTVLFLARRWESRAEDSVVQRFVQLSAGVLLGAASFSLSDYLMVPWNDIDANIKVGIVNNGVEWNKKWQGFYGADSMPLLAGHIAYFGTLMWIVRWWRQSDILRKNRFSVWAIAWSVAMAVLVQGLFFFPGPWCYLFAGVTSFTLQMASPWIDYLETAMVTWPSRSATRPVRRSEVAPRLGRCGVAKSLRDSAVAA
ncbi:MAG: serine/threonine-protein kinase [Pirellula sp.]